MKLLALISLLLLAGASSAATIPECQVGGLGALTQNPSLSTCISTSGVVFSELTDTPTDAQLTAMCAADSCVALLKAILAINPADCTLPVGVGIALRSQLVDPAVAFCKKSGVSGFDAASAGSASGSSSTSDASVGTVKAADTAGSSADATTTTSVPSPTPSTTTNAAAHVVGTAVSSAVAVALAASMW
uniref:Elicitin n=1 Tax=Globisporangium ultimum (strain ATCC 200006 / CBS 805.95 / DAOM BR144) TaxID=431595 RepID=K3WVI7_GLOUD